MVCFLGNWTIESWSFFILSFIFLVKLSFFWQTGKCHKSRIQELTFYELELAILLWLIKVKNTMNWWLRSLGPLVHIGDPTY